MGGEDLLEQADSVYSAVQWDVVLAAGAEASRRSCSPLVGEVAVISLVVA